MAMDFVGWALLVIMGIMPIAWLGFAPMPSGMAYNPNRFRPCFAHESKVIADTGASSAKHE